MEGKKFIAIENKRIRIDDIISYDVSMEELLFEKIYTPIKKTGIMSYLNSAMSFVWESEDDLELIFDERYQDLGLKNEDIPSGAFFPFAYKKTYKKIYDSDGNPVECIEICSQAECDTYSAFATQDDVIKKNFKCLHIKTTQDDFWFSEYFMDDFQEVCDELDRIFT